MEHLNYHFHQEGDHKFGYDFQTLSKLLSRAGFKSIRRREFNPIRSESRRFNTLYVDANK